MINTTSPTAREKRKPPPPGRPTHITPNISVLTSQCTHDQPFLIPNLFLDLNQRLLNFIHAAILRINFEESILTEDDDVSGLRRWVGGVGVNGSSWDSRCTEPVKNEKRSSDSFGCSLPKSPITHMFL